MLIIISLIITLVALAWITCLAIQSYALKKIYNDCKKDQPEITPSEFVKDAFKF